MTTQGTIPPGERDLEIYRLVKVEQKSTRSVAEIVGISQTRVCQIVERVADFLIETAPAGEKDPQLQKQLNFARQLAGERIDFLVKQATRCFYKSKGTKATIRQVEVAGEKPTTVTTKRESQGEVQYLIAIARLAAIGSKLPAGGLVRNWDTESAERDAGEDVSSSLEATGASEQRVQERGAECATREAVSPSEGACSAEPSEQPVTANGVPLHSAITDYDQIVYSMFLKLKAEGKIEPPPTVHPTTRRERTENERARNEFLTGALVEAK
jgi:hypothetical protein